MFTLRGLKGQEQDGKPCLETGGKTGKVTLILTDKLSLSKSQRAMVALLYPTTSLPQAGPSARPSPAHRYRLDYVVRVCAVVESLEGHISNLVRSFSLGFHLKRSGASSA